MRRESAALTPPAPQGNSRGLTGITAIFTTVETHHFVAVERARTSWGEMEVECVEGGWSSQVPDCRILDCGTPPQVHQASTSLVNRTSLVGNIAVYSCNVGYIMVVNASTGEISAEF